MVKEEKIKKKEKKRVYADDDTSSLSELFKLRIFPLLIGLFLGLGISFITSRFEEVLSRNIALAFFLPLIVYLADSIGTQTQTIYIRDLRTGKANFKNYLVKETLLGIIFAFIFSVISCFVIFFWFKSLLLTLSIGISIFLVISIAPVMALCVTKVVYYFREDPAVAAGPIGTVIRDIISVVIYGYVSSLLIL
jgi:magnesium transporter